MIVAAGEALVDLVPDGELLRPLLGGSPYNVAIALARCGRPTAFLGRCSTDAFGVALTDRLVREGVDVGRVRRTHEPTTLAVVHLDGGQARYRFYLDGTSAAGLTRAELPALDAGAALHVSLGAVTLRTTPGGDALRHLIEREADRRVVALDPNVRPAVLDDPAGYARELERLLPGCALVKASEEDLATLYPDRAPLGTARAWAAAGPELVVVTRGGAGAVGLTAGGGEVEVSSPAVAVVDTVGAGDAFAAGLLAALDAGGRLSARTDLAALPAAELEGALTTAARIAAATCTRPGADPPREPVR